MIERYNHSSDPSAGQDDKLDPSSPIPLYYQLKERLQAQIRSGRYQPGDRIPTETELQENYGVSRITVRNAIAALVAEELLIKKQGLGTTVAKPRIVEDSTRLRSFTEKSMAQGAHSEEVEAKVLRVELMPAQPRICAPLGIPLESRVIYVRRLRMIHDEPIAVFENYIRSDIGVEINEDFSRSIYGIFEKDHGLTITGAERCIEASCAAGETAALLGLRQGDPILIIRNTTFMEGEIPIEYAEGVYRADRYKYTVKLKR